MNNEGMTVEQAYRELKGDIDGLRTEFKADLKDMATKADIKDMATKADIKDMATKADLKTETSRTRTWVISLFIGTVIIISTLVGVFANMIIAVLK